ncbi:MAG: hypothetical protein HQ503_11780 [Rhodospirillales bacterium]|nr:hypothetical protein [Rhodospirillales bacterium]
MVLPEKARMEFVIEMQSHLVGFDEILSAIAEGDFKEAARIAENHLNFGRNIWVEMAARGLSREKISGMRKRYRAMNPAEKQKLRNEMGVRGNERLPSSFNSSIQLFYGATGDFAELAKNVGDEPTPDDYEKLFAALQQITSVCRGCHTAYQLR